MESLYSVVYFVNEDTVDVVPSNWIKDIDTCAWPFNRKNAKKMIEQKYQPNNKEFAFFKIRMLCSGIKTLAEARFIAKKAELTSDLPDDDFSRKQIKINKFSSTKSMECPIYYSDFIDSDGSDIGTMCKKNKKMKINLLEKKNGWTPSFSFSKNEGAESTLSSKKKVTFGDNDSDAEKFPLFKRNSIDDNNHMQTSLFSHFMTNSDAEKFPLFKRNSIDDNNHTQTSLFSHFMTNSDAEKSTLLKRNSFDESNHTKISSFSPLMINSDKDRTENHFFKKKVTFGGNDSGKKDYQLENIRHNINPCKSLEYEGISYHNTFPFRTDNSKLENIGDISHRNSPDFSNNFNLAEISTGRKSYSLCEDHDAINDKEFKKQIIGHVMYFKVELKHLTNTLTNNHNELLERVQSIEKCLEDTPTKLYEQTNVDINCMSDCSLPIDNVVDLNTLEYKTLGDQKFKKALINKLSHVGGKNVKTAVKRIMSKLFTNSFLAEYSFTGKRGKKKFCDLFIFPIILKSIKKQVKFKSASDHEIEEPLKIYLAQAPFANKR